MNMKKTMLNSLVVSAFALTATAVMAEVNEGTVLSAANIDSLYDDTFEGHKIKDLLTEKMEWRIRENGLEMPLVHSKKIEMDAKWIERSKSNVGVAKLNEQTRQVEGWQGGMPFPNIDE